MPNDYNNLSLEELAALRLSLAKRANRQMLRWENAGMAEKASAYSKNAMPYLKRQGRTRFSTAKNPMAAKTPAAQRAKEMAEIAQIEKYINAPSYGISGYNAIKKRAAEGFACAAGVDLKDGQVETLLKSEHFGWLKRTLGSGVVMDISRAIAAGQSTAAEVLDRVEKMQVKYSDAIDLEEDFEDKPIDEIFQELGLNYDAILFHDAPEEENPFDYSGVLGKKPKWSKKTNKAKSKKKTAKKSKKRNRKRK